MLCYDRALGCQARVGFGFGETDQDFPALTLHQAQDAEAPVFDLRDDDEFTRFQATTRGFIDARRLWILEGQLMEGFDPGGGEGLTRSASAGARPLGDPRHQSHGPVERFSSALRLMFAKAAKQ